MVKFGLALEPTMPHEEAIGLAKLAEANRIEHVWVCDNSPSPPFGDVFVTLAAIAVNTKVVKLGTSLCNPYTRNPAIIAASIMALDNLSKGRAILGLGPGSNDGLASIGLSWRKPVTTVKDAVNVCRKFFNGEIVTMKSPGFQVSDVEFSKSPRSIPIYLGGSGQKMLGLAGEVADGVLLTCGSDYLPTAIGYVQKGADRLGRDLDELDVSNSLVISVSDDEVEAKDVAREIVLDLVAWGRPEVLAMSGIKGQEQDMIRQKIDRDGPEKAVESVTDKMVDALAAAGTIEKCQAKCLDQIKKGVEQVIFCLPFGPDPEEAVQRIGKELVPKIREKQGQK
jgi:5,10-methylenetetrahydromethanopterin reductase